MKWSGAEVEHSRSGAKSKWIRVKVDWSLNGAEPKWMSQSGVPFRWSRIEVEQKRSESESKWILGGSEPKRIRVAVERHRSRSAAEPKWSGVHRGGARNTWR